MSAIPVTPSRSARSGRATPVRSQPRRAAQPGRSGLSQWAGGARIARRGMDVRWDRVGSVAMLCVLGALVYLYLSAGINMFSTWRQARGDSATVVSLQREHSRLVLQHEALARRGTLEAEARRLGMSNRGEQQYIISGLPKN